MTQKKRSAHVYSAEDVQGIIRTGKGKVVLPTWPTGEQQDRLELCRREGVYLIGRANETYATLATRVSILPLRRYPRAVDLAENRVSYRPDSVAFRDIVERSNEPGSQCKYQVSFFVFEASWHRYLDFLIDFRRLPHVFDDLTRHLCATSPCTMGREQVASCFDPVVFDLETPFMRPDDQELEMVVAFHQKRLMEISQ